jgi:hypothetical protein
MEWYEPVARERHVVVSTKCPFCGGGIPLLNARVDNASAIDIGARFAGESVVCRHPRCEREFVVRRADLTIRRRAVRP